MAVVWRAAATATLGHGGETEERGGEGGPESEGEVRGGSGRRVASPGHRGGARQAGREEVAGARGRARHASGLLARRKTTGGVEMGWAMLLGQVGYQVSAR